ncbi:MAG: 50S ribosomal protein L6, partial [Pseudothermotoga sp.]
MSKLGKKPIVIPAGVEVQLESDTITVKGPKGTLSQKLSPYVKVEIQDGNIWVRQNEEKMIRKSFRRVLKMFQGTYWSLIRNMIQGV